MSFARPSLTELISRIQSDVESRLPGTDPRLRRAALSVLARAVAGAAHGQHGHLDWNAKQIIPDMADEEIFARHASWWGVPRKEASAATGPVTFAGADGSVIPAGAALQRSDGWEYTTDAEATIAAGTAAVAVTGSVAGQDGNADAGVSLTLVAPLPGVQSSCTVAAGGLTGGADIETLESWKDRLRKRVQQPPHGGSKSDYETWALAVEGVTRAWPLPEWLGVGTVGLAFVRDDDVDMIPDAGEVQTVQEYLDARRPVTAQVIVFAPTAVAVAMTIKLSPNTAAVQASVTAELQDLFRREAQVEDGTGSGTIKISRINEVISLADGEDDHALVTPAANVTLAKGQIAKLGTITWQAL